jgi:hypothetical protein
VGHGRGAAALLVARVPKIAQEAKVGRAIVEIANERDFDTRDLRRFIR